jgi:uncharacterized protein YegP (UPF0339 family)
MPGRFVVNKNEKGKYYFRLEAGNYEPILQSQMYESLDGCMNGIESVRKNAASAAQFKSEVAKNGEFYFTLVAGNGQTIGKSEMYKAAASRDNGIQSVMRNAPEAKVVDRSAEG